MDRYSVITSKNPREIVLLRGSGCAWRKCPFCDYHLDFCTDTEKNHRLNKEVLRHVTGCYGELEVINSGSVFELDDATLEDIRALCREKGIERLHFESHFMYRDRISALREFFSGIKLYMKLGLETFDADFRERILKKGIPVSDPEVIARDFDEANFLFGIKGQTYESMKNDIELGLKYFERICINIFCRNTTGVPPDRSVIKLFKDTLYPVYLPDNRVDILINNTDFGVGA